MKRMGLFAALCVATICATTPVMAQATRTWVSGVGDDANPCSRTAPCKTFPGAISKTAAGGEIDVLDPGGFGSVTITKSITIASEGAGEGGVLVSGTNGIVVSAGATDVVILRGLQIEGIGTGLSGVRFNSGGSLIIEHSTIRNFRDSSTGYGVYFAPNSNASLLISESSIVSNGSGANGGGIFIQPSSAATVLATVNNTSVFNNTAGIRADGSTTTGRIDLVINNSTSTGNSRSGIVSRTVPGAGIVNVVVNRSVSSNNHDSGVIANGTGASLRTGASVISGNGVGATAANGGVLSSFGDNQVIDNLAAGSAMSIIGLN